MIIRKKKNRVDTKEKIKKVEKKYDRISKSRSPKRRFDNRSYRDNRMQRDGHKYRKDDRYNNKFSHRERKNRSKDKERFDKKKKDNRRSSSSSSDHKKKRKVKNDNSFSLSPEVKE